MSNYGLRQFEIYKLRAMRAHAKIVSGAYKFQKVFKCIPGGERECTHDEKLEMAFQKLDSHIKLLDELNDSLSNQESKVDY